MTETKTAPVGRVARRRVKTREALLNAAYTLMSKGGVEGTSVQDITELADVGYGTFFNHFESKDDIVLAVLDCLINNIGQRNDIATSAIKRDHPAEVVCTSVRLVIRELITSPIWGWLMLRPDLLVGRMRSGFYDFGIRDFNIAIDMERFVLDPAEVEIGWSFLMWALAGCAKDISDGYSPRETEAFYVELIMRAMGLSPGDARRLGAKKLPKLPDLAIDFSYQPVTEA